jgi:hypothetical protein
MAMQLLPPYSVDTKFWSQKIITGAALLSPVTEMLCGAVQEMPDRN